MLKQQADYIITEYLQKIYGFAVKKSFSYEEAEDLCADIIEEVYKSLRKADEIHNLEGYIWRISEHTYAKYVAEKKRKDGIAIDEMEKAVYDTYFFEDEKEELAKLRREVAFLTEKRRKVVYLFYYEKKTITEIANEMQLPEGTVKWHLNQARNELKEGFSMERKIGRLGLNPISAKSIGHNGNPGKNGGPEYYLEDKLNLNIVYSVYFNPKTREEIAEELGVTPVFIEDKINYLEANGFLVPVSGKRYTTYVFFDPETYSLERKEYKLKKMKEIAEILVKEYVPQVREAFSDLKEVYLPTGNRELLEATAIFMGICGADIGVRRDLSKYVIKTTNGGWYIAMVNLPSQQSDPEYQATMDPSLYYSEGSMGRLSQKYPAVYSWSVNSRYCNRTGFWQNNLVTDYEYLYEFMKGMLTENAANTEKYERLREKQYLSADNKVQLVIVKEDSDRFFKRLPILPEEIKKEIAKVALDYAMGEVKNYPARMQDLVIHEEAGSFIGNFVAMMVLEILYENGTFQLLTEEEKITSLLVMFSDVLPE